MLFGRAALYFDEVARRGVLRRAAEILRIAPSAVDRQIRQLEDQLGTQLFDRTSNGMRMTAAGELLVDGIRRWQRDFQRIQAEIDNLVGLRRGEITVGLIEGAAEFAAKIVASFRQAYPGIHFTLVVEGAQGIGERLLKGDFEVGITVNPPGNASLRVENTLIYGLGAIVQPSHPLADRQSVTLLDCAEYPQIIPAENLSLRRILEKAWHRQFGGTLRGVAEVNSTRLMKALVFDNVGIGWMTAFDAVSEIQNGSLVFLPLSTKQSAEFSALSIITASGRNLSVPASLFVQHASSFMNAQDVPAI